MFKKLIVFVLAAMTILSVAAYGEENADSISVVIDGEQVLFDQPPIMENGRVLVPFRAIFEALGARVEWVEETETVFATKRRLMVSMDIGSEEMFVNGVSTKLDVPSRVVNGRTLVPLRAVSEALSADVVWDGDMRTVSIKSVQGQHIIKDRYIGSDTVVDTADGQRTILSGFAAYPEISNPEGSKLISDINDALRKYAEDFNSSCDEEYGLLARENYDASVEEGYEFTAYSYSSTFDITFDDNNILSIVKEEYAYLGGAHPSVTMVSETYDLASGRKLELGDILSLSQEEINDLIIDAAMELYNQSPDIYYPNAADLIKTNVSETGYYLTDDGIKFYYPVYSIAPHAAGNIVFGLSYGDLVDVLKINFK